MRAFHRANRAAGAAGGLFLLLCGVAHATTPPTIGGDPSVLPSDFRITSFASGLYFPTSMQQLDSTSLLVGCSVPNPGGNFFNSTGELLRLIDADGNGVADATQVLAMGLPGGITSVRQSGDLVFVTSGGNAVPTISVLRKGATVSSSYTLLGSISFNFPSTWEHTTYALAARPTPGVSGSTDLFFNVGSALNNADTPPSTTVSTSGMLSATLHGDSIYMTRVTQGTSGPTFSMPIQIASGLRNAAGIAFHPTTHDLYFEDNGIDRPDNEELSTDEMNRIRAADIGNGVPNFGFAHDYIEYRTGNRIGSGAVQPLGVFQPYPDPNTGAESAGANEIAFAPARFPGALSGGTFIGFHGEFDQTGAANGENTVVYFDPETGKYFHFIESGQEGLGHPDGLLATDDSLFVADMTSGSIFAAQGLGSIYQIQAVPELGTWRMTEGCMALTALGRRSRARSLRRLAAL